MSARDRLPDLVPEKIYPASGPERVTITTHPVPPELPQRKEIIIPRGCHLEVQVVRDH